MTSTDIKLEYGPANLAKLDEYDQNFTLFAQTIYAYGERLHTLGFDHEAMRVLRFGIDSLSDISGNYKLLATLYVKYGQNDKLEELKKENMQKAQESLTDMGYDITDEELETILEEEGGGVGNRQGAEQLVRKGKLKTGDLRLLLLQR